MQRKTSDAATSVGRGYRTKAIKEHIRNRVLSYLKDKEALENNHTQDSDILEGASEEPAKTLKLHSDGIHSHPGARLKDHSLYRYFFPSATKRSTACSSPETSTSNEHKECNPTD
jgi:hypothetical protein